MNYRYVSASERLSFSGRDGSRKASSKTSFNRFSVFVKSGSENYILGKANFPVPDPDVITVLASTLFINKIKFNEGCFYLSCSNSLAGLRIRI